MTNEQIRVKIAEAIGWKPYPGKTWVDGQKYGVPPGGAVYDDWDRFPNYPEDLNAIRSAVMTLPKKSDGYGLLNSSRFRTSKIQPR